MTLALRPYQIEGRDFLASRRFALLADEMRVGKTPQAILAAHKLGLQKILVVCPAIAVQHWDREFVKWYDMAGTAMLPLTTVLSYDKAKLLAAELTARRWDLVIVDECHYAKNPDTQRTKLIYGKNGLGWHTDRMWALSGTPATKHAGELWAMLYAFGVVGMNYGEFLRRYCIMQPFTLKVIGTKPAMVPELRALLAQVMLRRTRRQVAPEMPAIGFEFLPVTIDKDLPPPGVDYEALTSDDFTPEVRQAVALAKVPQLADEIAFAIANGLLQQTVVFGYHRTPLHAMFDQLTRRGIHSATITGETPAGQRQFVQDEFRAGRLEVVLGNIIAAGTAIDLSSASHGYFLELDWLPANNAQAANRLVSMDKAESVTFDVVTMPGSVDDKINRILLRRSAELCKLL